MVHRTIVTVLSVALSVALSAAAEPTELTIRTYDSEAFSRLVAFRVGTGSPKYFHTLGDVRAEPGGEVLYRYEGFETCRLAPGSRTATSATQLSRRIFFYCDATTGAYLRQVDGHPVLPTACDYLIMEWSLQDDGTVLIEGTQGKEPHVVRTRVPGPTCRALPDGTLVFPVNLQFTAGAYSFHEIGTYVSPPTYASDGDRCLAQFCRLQPLPRWSPLYGQKKALLDLTVQGLSAFDQLPARLTDLVRREYPLYVAPPRDLAECLALQAGPTRR